MALFQNQAKSTEKPIGSEVQAEYLPELNGLAGESQSAWNNRLRKITYIEDDGSLMGIRYTTGYLPYNASPSTVQAALEALAPLSGNIVVSGGGSQLQYAFKGALANKGIKRMYATHNTGISSKVMKETLTGATGGTRTFTYNGQTTAGLAYNASAATVQTAIQGLSSVGAGNILVTAGGAGELVFTYAAAFANSTRPSITSDGTSLTGTSPTSVMTVTTQGSEGIETKKSYFETIVRGFSARVQQLIKEELTSEAINSRAGGGTFEGFDNPIPTDVGGTNRYVWTNKVMTEKIVPVKEGTPSGTRTLSFSGQTTSALAFDATAATIQAALEALSNVGVGDILVSQTGDTITYSYAGALTGVQPSLTSNSASLVNVRSSMVVRQEGSDIPTIVETV